MDRRLRRCGWLEREVRVEGEEQFEGQGESSLETDEEDEEGRKSSLDEKRD